MFQEHQPKGNKCSATTITELQDRLKKFDKIISGLKPPISGRILGQIIQAKVLTEKELETLAKMN